jgi:predicted alpha/beta hydrolase
MFSATSSENSATVEEICFVARDGRTLSGRLHHPEATPHIAVVVHGGLGFPARFYQDFASWLSQTHRAAVLTYDYRDFGWSLDGSLARSNTCLSDWSIKDQSAAFSFLRSRFPGLPPRVLGHSLGGLCLAFHDDVAQIDRVVAVGSGPGFWLDHPWPMKAKAAVFWTLGPVAAWLAGYMPGRLFGLGADIPSGVYWEWRALCLRRSFGCGDWGRRYPRPRLEEARFKLTIAAIADDVIIAPHMVRKLPAFYPYAEVSEMLLDPVQLGLKALGHAGVFFARNKVCWPLIAAPLLDSGGSDQPSAPANAATTVQPTEPAGSS